MDVFRSPPASLDDKGQYFPDVRIYVVPPGKRVPKGAPPGVQNPAPAPTPPPGTGADGGTSPTGGATGG